ncbi:MAG: hypothetical protein WKF33_04415 [Thermoleophilaceae bacterium]|jgi:hypothetical protein
MRLLGSRPEVMTVELLYFNGCPSHEALLPRLGELLDEVGARDRMRLREVGSLEEAEAEGFLGSPTVRVNGSDVEPGGDERSDFGLKCRLYRTQEGASPIPPEEWIRAALDRARMS